MNLVSQFIPRYMVVFFATALISVAVCCCHRPGGSGKTARLDLFLHSGGEAISKPLQVIGALKDGDGSMAIVLSEQSKIAMANATEQDEFEDSLLLVVLEDDYLGHHKNYMGLSSGFLCFPEGPINVEDKLKKYLVKIVEVDSLPFTYDEAISHLD